MRERPRRKYLRIVKVVLRTELYGRNKILAFNGFALPVFTYGFGVIHWGCMDLQQLDRRTRNLLSMHSVHHPVANIDRLYASCIDGGRRLQQIESTYQSCIVRLNCYLADSSDPFIQMIRECDSVNLHTRSSAWFVALLHSCGGVLLRTTSRRTYTGMHPSRLKMASSKCLKQMQDITVRVAVLFVCGAEREAYGRAVSPSH